MPYDIIFDEKVLSALATKDFKTAIQEYVRRRNELLAATGYLRTILDITEEDISNLPVERYVPPEEFDEIGAQCRKLGFSFVASGPFVRSSYHAGEMADALAR